MLYKRTIPTKFLRNLSLLAEEIAPQEIIQTYLYTGQLLECFYIGIINGQYQTDSEAEKALYGSESFGNQPSQTPYIKLKNKLKTRLMVVLSAIDTDNELPGLPRN